MLGNSDQTAAALSKEWSNHWNPFGTWLPKVIMSTTQWNLQAFKCLATLSHQISYLFSWKHYFHISDSVFLFLGIWNLKNNKLLFHFFFLQHWFFSVCLFVWLVVFFFKLLCPTSILIWKAFSFSVGLENGVEQYPGSLF